MSKSLLSFWQREGFFGVENAGLLECSLTAFFVSRRYSWRAIRAAMDWAVIVEFKQGGATRAECGKRLLPQSLTADSSVDSTHQICATCACFAWFPQFVTQCVAN